MILWVGWVIPLVSSGLAACTFGTYGQLWVRELTADTGWNFSNAGSQLAASWFRRALGLLPVQILQLAHTAVAGVQRQRSSEQGLLMLRFQSGTMSLLPILLGKGTHQGSPDSKGGVLDSNSGGEEPQVTLQKHGYRDGKELWVWFLCVVSHIGRILYVHRYKQKSLF